MIEFTHATTRYTVKPENAEQYRRLAAKPPAIKRKIDRKRDATRRDYPQFHEGMTTVNYIRQYLSLNSRLLLEGEGFTFTDRIAPTLNPMIPEVFEELDPDYVLEFLSTPRPKKQTVADLRKAIKSAMDVLHAGDIDTAQCVLNESLK